MLCVYMQFRLVRWAVASSWGALRGDPPRIAIELIQGGWGCLLADSIELGLIRQHDGIAQLQIARCGHTSRPRWPLQDALPIED